MLHVSLTVAESKCIRSILLICYVSLHNPNGIQILVWEAASCILQGCGGKLLDKNYTKGIL